MAQSGSMLVAAFYLEKAMVEDKEEIDAVPIDEEVAEADRKAEKFKEDYVEVTKWSVLPTWMKAFLLFALMQVRKGELRSDAL